jgi:hypothetical protein
MAGMISSDCVSACVIGAARGSWRLGRHPRARAQASARRPTSRRWTSVPDWKQQRPHLVGPGHAAQRPVDSFKRWCASGDVRGGARRRVDHRASDVARRGLRGSVAAGGAGPRNERSIRCGPRRIRQRRRARCANASARCASHTFRRRAPGRDRRDRCSAIAGGRTCVRGRRSMCIGLLRPGDLLRRRLRRRVRRLQPAR